MKEYSSIYTIAAPVARVFAVVSNFEHLQPILTRLQTDTALQETLAEQGLPNILASLQEVTLTADSLTVPTTMLGTVSLRITERQENRCVKYTTEQSPLRATLWVQVLPNDDETTKMKLTIDADIPLVLRPMIGNKLKEGVEQIAAMLARIQY